MMFKKHELIHIKGRGNTLFEIDYIQNSRIWYFRDRFNKSTGTNFVTKNRVRKITPKSIIVFIEGVEKMFYAKTINLSDSRFFRELYYDSKFKQCYSRTEYLKTETLIRRDGISNIWYENGQPKRIMTNRWSGNVSQNSRRSGEYKTFFYNGQLEDHFNYDDQGRRNGICIRHSRFGRMLLKTFWYKAVQIPEWLFTEPTTLHPEEILEERNVEIRRAMIELMGYDKLMEKLGNRAKSINKNQDSKIGELIKITIPGKNTWSRSRRYADIYGFDWRRSRSSIETVMLLKVQDGTSPKSYYLRVPLTMKTALQANAWTWKMRSTQYKPIAET